jgi:hypothetical protein
MYEYWDRVTRTINWLFVPPLRYLEPSASSNISAIGYHGKSRFLLVRFKSGAVYGYSLVPWRVVGKMLRADSIGAYFNREIKAAHYPVSMWREADVKWRKA